MNEQHYREAAYYAAVFTVAFLAAMCRVVRDGSYRSRSRALAFALTGGCVGFGLTAILVDYTPDGWIGGASGLGIAALLGLTSKEQDGTVRAVLKAVWKRAGIEVKDSESGN